MNPLSVVVVDDYERFILAPKKEIQQWIGNRTFSLLPMLFERCVPRLQLASVAGPRYNNFRMIPISERWSAGAHWTFDSSMS